MKYFRVPDLKKLWKTRINVNAKLRLIAFSNFRITQFGLLGFGHRMSQYGTDDKGVTSTIITINKIVSDN